MVLKTNTKNIVFCVLKGDGKAIIIRKHQQYKYIEKNNLMR
jgi:hypothetical protein